MLLLLLVLCLSCVPHPPDLLQDGRIDYAEFCAMMLQGNEETASASNALKAGRMGKAEPRVTR